MHQASCSSLLSASRHCGQPKKEPQFPTSGSLHISPSWRQASGQTVEFDEKESMGGVKKGGVKSGGDTAGEGGRQGPRGRGWVDGGSATVGKLLSVKYT